MLVSFIVALWAISIVVCQASKAIDALKKHVADIKAKKKLPLLEEDGYVYLIASFKTVQQTRSAPKKM